MNAPRQGLFASLLIASFILHSFLLVLAANSDLNHSRATQGDLLTQQLVADSLNELNPPNTITLALLASRYATNPSIASLRILDKNNQVLATAGANKTRGGDIFARDALSNNQKIGRVEVTLIKPSLGETLRNQWLALLLCFIIHVALWVGYRLIARPTRSEWLAQKQQSDQLQQEIQRLAHDLEQERTQARLVVAKAKQVFQKYQEYEKYNVAPIAKTAEASEDELYLSIQYYDPKQLLATVSPRTAKSFFGLSQIFLNETVKACRQYFELSESQLEVMKSFAEDGALVRVDKQHQHAISAIILTAQVFQLLSEATYKRFREAGQFVLSTHCAVAEALPSMQLDAKAAALRLNQFIYANEIGIYIGKPSFKYVRHYFELQPLAEPSNTLTREAGLLQQMRVDYAEQAQQMRDRILHSHRS